MKKVRFVFTIIILIFIAVSVQEFNTIRQYQSRYKEAIKLLNKIGGNIYVAGNGLYVIGENKDSWNCISKKIGGGKHQEIGINSKSVLYCDYSGYRDYNETSVQKCSLHDLNNCEKIQYISKKIFDPICLSQDGKKVAYRGYPSDSPDPNLTTFWVTNLIDGQTSSYEIPRGLNSLSFSIDGNSIFVAGNNIYQINLKNGDRQKICSGYYVQCLNENEIVYTRDWTFYKFNLQTKQEKEVYTTDEYLLGCSWHKSGRYIVMSISTAIHRFLFIPDCRAMAVIVDTETKKEYLLPPFERCKSGSIYWID